MGLFLFFSLLSLYFVQIGINNYKSVIENKEIFQNFERLKVKQYNNYNQYGTYGFRILFVPSPLSIYYVNSSTISQLTANVDSGERLNIYNSFKGRTLFAEKSGGFKDFSGIMLLLGTLLVLYMGYEAFIHKDYLRYISGFVAYKKFFFSIVLSRVFTLILFFIFNTGLSLILLKINGVAFSSSEYVHLAIYMGILVLMVVLFFAIGTIAGSFKSRFAGFVMIILAWFTFVFLIPGVIGAITSRRAASIASNYHLELQKLTNIMDFEKLALKKVGATTKYNIDSVKKLIEKYWNNEFKQIQALEKRLENEMKKNIRHFQNLSLIFPSTFYLSAGNEISSKGYENFILFFGYIQALKEKFVRFYIDHRYYSDAPPDKPAVVESFIKGNENLFNAKSRLPKNFFKGVLLILVYVIGLLTVSYYRFKKSLRH